MKVSRVLQSLLPVHQGQLYHRITTNSSKEESQTLKVFIPFIIKKMSQNATQVPGLVFAEETQGKDPIVVSSLHYRPMTPRLPH